MRYFLAVLFWVACVFPASAQRIVVGAIDGNGYFDAQELRQGLIGYLSDQRCTQWVIVDGQRACNDDRLRGAPRLELSYRYAVGYSGNGRGGSGGYWGYSAGGSSEDQQQVALLTMRIMLYGANGDVLLNRQVQAVGGESYPTYSNVGISTPYFQFSSWSYANTAQLAQLTLQQQLMAVASAKAVHELVGWWADPASTPYRCVAVTQPTDGLSPTQIQTAPGAPRFGGPPMGRFFEALQPADVRRYRPCRGLVIWTKRGQDWQVLERVPLPGIQFSAAPSGAWITRTTPKELVEYLQFEVP